MDKTPMEKAYEQASAHFTERQRALVEKAGALTLEECEELFQYPQPLLLMAARNLHQAIREEKERGNEKEIAETQDPHPDAASAKTA